MHVENGGGRSSRLRQAQPTLAASATQPASTTTTTAAASTLEDPSASDAGGVALGEVLSLESDARAPLRIIAGYLAVVTPPAELAAAAPAVAAAVRLVERLVESAADLARGRAGLLLRAPIDLAGFWARVQTECAGLVEFWHPGGELRFAINGAPAVIMGDAAALRRALLNLIESALYWSEHGQVVVGSGQAHNAWVVEVISGEPGLPAGIVSAVQDPNSGGLLGLRQARAVARGHGGGLAAAADRVQLVIPLDG